MTTSAYTGGELEDPDALDSDSDKDLLTLSSSTLTALTSFFDEQKATRDHLLSLSIQSQYVNSVETANGASSLKPSLSDCPEAIPVRDNWITVQGFKAAFKEDWQLSQFWYSQGTAERLTRALKEVCGVNDRVAFLCCPTGYVAFRESGVTAKEIFLLEHDARFAILGGVDFVQYDLEEPLSFERAGSFRGSIDIVVVDPPFHSEVSQKKLSSTITHIIRPGGSLIVLTGLALAPLISSIYPPPLPQLHRRDIAIEHDGLGRLETPYGCWVGGGKDPSKNICFGDVLDEN